MKIGFLFLFCLSFFASYSQVTIKGIISSNDTAVSNVLVEVYSTQLAERLDYTISDDQGRYELSLKKGTYSFKISHLAYFTVYQNYELNNSQRLDFTLEENPQHIGEVNIESRALDFFVNGDTTNYNLNKLTNGNEETLKEVLEKLPGIDIDENGKILSNGKKIDKLLIDGNDFFGDQHQLATEYLSSEIIEGVSKLENYQDAFDLKGVNPSGITALNVQIDEEYKGQFKGQVEGHLGFKDRYHFTANGYSFREKTNVYFIANSNNLGEQTFTIEDYIGFQGGIERLTQQSNQLFGNIDLNIPEFLFSNNEVKAKQDHLGALNFSFAPQKRLKANTHVILNKTNTIEEQLSKQQFSNGQSNSISKKNDNSFLINTSFIELKYNLSPLSTLNYTAHLSPKNSEAFNNELFNDQPFTENRKQTGFSINQNLEYKRLLGKKSRLSTSLYYNNNAQDNILAINSTEAFIDSVFNKNDDIIEEINTHKKTLGLNTSFKAKLSSFFSTEITHNISENENLFRSSLFQNIVHIKHIENLLGFRFFKRDRTFFNYEIGANYLGVQRNALAIKNHLLPYTAVRLNFSQSHYLSLNYKHSVEYVNAKHLVSWPYVANYNTLYRNQELQIDDYASFHKLNLQYIISDQFSGTYAMFGSSFRLAENTPTINTTLFWDSITNYYQKAPATKEYSSYLFVEKNVYKLPLIVESKTTLSSSEQIAYLEGQEDLITTQSIGTQLLFSSRFKNPIFNLEAAYKININFIESNNKLIQNKVVTLSPYINLLFKYKQLKAQLSTNFRRYDATNYRIQRLIISPLFKYHKNKSKWEFSLRGYDLLNLRNNEILKIENHYSFIQEKTISIMGGYIVAGIKYIF